MERRTLNRRTLLESGITLQGALGLSPRLGATAAAQEIAQAGKGPLNASAEAKKIAYDTIGKGPKAFMISGFPSTRRSWNRLIPLLSQRHQCIPADLPSFGDSGILNAPATTENVARVFHEFVVSNLETPIHVVAHDFGAWCAYSWALLFPSDFKTLTLIEAGIPGLALANDLQLSDYKRKWNFIFQCFRICRPRSRRARKTSTSVGGIRTRSTSRDPFLPATLQLTLRRTHGPGEWMRHSTTAATSSWTWNSTRRTSRRSCRCVCLRWARDICSFTATQMGTIHAAHLRGRGETSPTPRSALYG